jgi:SAM-dependent methyltransferase
MVSEPRTAARIRAALTNRTDPTTRLYAWLAALQSEDGIRIVSAPVHFGGTTSGETDYANQFTHNEALEQRIGDTLARALADADRSAPALEIGAGTGILSRPLVERTDYPAYFITDTSPDFLRLTRSSIGERGAEKRIEYVVLSGDELDRWPERTVSLVVLRYTLHHVLDWQRFVHLAAGLLVPGGVLAVEEPFADGFLLQAALADVLGHSPGLRRKMSRSVRRDLEFMADTTFFYADAAADKSTAEDKHVFPAFRLLEVCREAGLVPRLYPNQGIDGGLASPNVGHGSFAVDFRHNLAVNFGFGQETLEFFDRYLAGTCERLARLDPSGGGPIVRAVVLADKPREHAALDELRAVARRVITSRAPSRVQGPSDPPPGFQLTLDYAPSALPAPRWGYERPSHPLLLARIAAHEESYRTSLESIAAHADQLAAIDTVAADPREPSWINGFLPGLDGAALYSFVRARRPRRYLEVGSGNSTKFVARARRDGELSTRIVSIDPAPRAEVNDLCDVVIREPLEATSLAPFTELEAGDIVFFDGSHRTFMNSDATVFLLEVLPTLPEGTLVGIHDIHLPDDYPAEWTERHYSEQYLLAAYLLAGCRWFEPRLAAWYVSRHSSLAAILEPLWGRPGLGEVQRHGGAFWLEITSKSG